MQNWLGIWQKIKKLNTAEAAKPPLHAAAKVAPIKKGKRNLIVRRLAFADRNTRAATRNIAHYHRSEHFIAIKNGS